jgi:hypothetical protein
MFSGNQLFAVVDQPTDQRLEAASSSPEGDRSDEPQAATATGRPLRGIGLRRTDRQEGLKLLYGAALDAARQQNRIQDSTCFSQESSGIEGNYFVVRDIEGNEIIAVSLDKARQVLAYRRLVARRILDRLNFTINSERPVGPQKNALRLLAPEIRALVWAISTGRRIPEPPERTLEPLISVGLLLCCVVPGVLYIKEGISHRRHYRDELAGLVKRWRKLGQPDPADSFFAHYHL